MKKTLLSVIILFSLFINSYGQTNMEQALSIYNKSLSLEQKGQYAEALINYIKAYEFGEEYFAPMKISEFYALGKGIEKNYKESNKWLIIAANSGNPQAQNMLGDSYYYGLGGSMNLQEAAKWYLRAAEQGYVDAQFKIALAYLDGEGVAPNNDIGLTWLLKAANNNHPDAQDALAIIYGFGKNGVQQDEKEFVRWALKAAQNG